MSREWKPGDVATLTTPDGSEYRVMRSDGFWECSHSTWRDGRATFTARPLVVIDPEDRAQVERLSKAMHESDHIAPWHDLHAETRDQIECAMQDALRSLITPPKPEEPTDPAVRVGAGGRTWAKVGPWWVCADLGEVPREWDYLVELGVSL